VVRFEALARLDHRRQLNCEGESQTSAGALTGATSIETSVKHSKERRAGGARDPFMTYSARSAATAPSHALQHKAEIAPRSDGCSPRGTIIHDEF
jgi:hypothetical protein